MDRIEQDVRSFFVMTVASRMQAGVWVGILITPWN